MIVGSKTQHVVPPASPPPFFGTRTASMLFCRGKDAAITCVCTLNLRGRDVANTCICTLNQFHAFQKKSLGILNSQGEHFCCLFRYHPPLNCMDQSFPCTNIHCSNVQLIPLFVMQCCMGVLKNPRRNLSLSNCMRKIGTTANHAFLSIAITFLLEDHRSDSASYNGYIQDHHRSQKL